MIRIPPRPKNHSVERDMDIYDPCVTRGPFCGETAVAILSQALFCTPLQPSQRPDAVTVQREVLHRLGACASNLGYCICEVAQKAGDYPELYITRMAWCRTTVIWAFAACSIGVNIQHQRPAAAFSS
ncbi:hypothetical protein [Streptomyces sp. NPDC048419]|uniref:hypothetical protein n=1 Tax=Streptomyces sp. NPDC048419 TaxID=3365547 RepID=UPI00371EF673